MNENVIQYPLYNDVLFSKAKRMADYEKLKTQYIGICKILEDIEERGGMHDKPRNPRQDIRQRQDKNNLRVLQQRKIRLEDSMRLLEGQIKDDIEKSKL